MSLMIPVKEAVKHATQQFGDLFPNVNDVRLEEVVVSDEGPWWDVTLSFAVPATSALDQVMRQGSREYKRILISRETGELQSVLIRKV